MNYRTIDTCRWMEIPNRQRFHDSGWMYPEETKPPNAMDKVIEFEGPNWNQFMDAETIELSRRSYKKLINELRDKKQIDEPEEPEIRHDGIEHHDYPKKQDMVTESELAELFGIHVKHIVRLRTQCGMPYHTDENGKIRISIQEVTDWQCS